MVAFSPRNFVVGIRCGSWSSTPGKMWLWNSCPGLTPQAKLQVNSCNYHASGLMKRRRLTGAFYMKMGVSEHRWKFLLRVDQMVKESGRVDRPLYLKGVDTAGHLE